MFPSLQRTVAHLGGQGTLRSGVILLSRFGLVGLFNTVVGLSIIAGLDIGLGVNPALANAAGYAVGICLSFVLNRKFVFRSQTGLAASARKFLVAVGGAFLLNQVVLHAVGRLLGSGSAAHLAAQLLGMATYTVASFIACRYWVFRGGAEAGPPTEP